MRPHISLITLAVEDLQRAVAFYRDGLGLPTNGIMGTEFEIGAVAFFDLQPDLKLAVWPRTSLAADTGLPFTGGGTGSFSLAHNVASQEEVDATLSRIDTTTDISTASDADLVIEAVTENKDLKFLIFKDLVWLSRLLLRAV